MSEGEAEYKNSNVGYNYSQRENAENVGCA